MNQSNQALELLAQRFRDQHLAQYLDDIEAEEVAPTFAEFIFSFSLDGAFRTPVGTVVTNDWIEHIHTLRQEDHEKFQLDALKGEQVSEKEAAAKWNSYCVFMQAAAADFYKDDIVEDYAA